MTDQEIGIAIAEADGWIKFWNQTGDEEHVGRWEWHKGNSNLRRPPDFCRDLNAMHEAAITKGPEVIKGMRFWLYEFCGQMTAHEASARQRSEAFLRTIGKWKDE